MLHYFAAHGPTQSVNTYALSIDKEPQTTCQIHRDVEKFTSITGNLLLAAPEGIGNMPKFSYFTHSQSPVMTTRDKKLACFTIECRA